MATDNIKYTKRDNFSDIRDYIERDGDLDPETQARWLTFIDRELELMGQRVEKQKKYQKIHDAAHDELSDGIFNLLCTPALNSLCAISQRRSKVLRRRRLLTGLARCMMKGSLPRKPRVLIRLMASAELLSIA